MIDESKAIAVFEKERARLFESVGIEDGSWEYVIRSDGQEPTVVGTNLVSKRDGYEARYAIRVNDKDVILKLKCQMILPSGVLCEPQLVRVDIAIINASPYWRPGGDYKEFADKVRAAIRSASGQR